MGVLGVVTSAVNEYISIKAISEEDYILLVSEVDISPCKEVRVKAERGKHVSHIYEYIYLLLTVRESLQINSPRVVREELQIVHLWERLQLLLQLLFGETWW